MSYMETNRLRQFCLIVETGSLSRAAELLHVTHSALSKSMGTLQLELKKRLLQPNGRGIAVTREGLDIYEKAKAFLSSEQDLFFEKNITPTPEVRIGAVEVFSMAITSGLALSALKGVPIKIVDIEPGAMEHQISAGNLDFGITYLPFATPDIRLIPLGKFSVGCFHQKNALRDHKFEDLPFVVPAKILPENPLGIKERDGWRDSLFHRKVLFKTNLLSTALDLTASGACAMIMPGFVARLFNQANKGSDRILIERPLPEKIIPPQTAYVMCSERYVEDHYLRAICKIIKSSLKQV
jgi:DNA-binding transcriptional LysR family regulator